MTGVLLVPHMPDSPHLDQVAAGLASAAVHGWQTVYAELDPGDNTHYWKTLNRWWRHSADLHEDLMIVEHDIVCRYDVFDQLALCPEPVCAFTYWLGGNYGYGLGCTRFRHLLLEQQPETVHLAGQQVTDRLPVGDWRRMDTRMWEVLGQPHQHIPPVEHLHDYPRHPTGTHL